MNELMTTREAAEYLKITTGYLHVMRHHGNGPECRKRDDGRIEYRRSALDTWNLARNAKASERAAAKAAKSRSGSTRRGANGPRGERGAGRKTGRGSAARA